LPTSAYLTDPPGLTKRTEPLMALNKEQQLLLARLGERVQELRGYL
jgi:hypothetical protein